MKKLERGHRKITVYPIARHARPANLNKPGFTTFYRLGVDFSKHLPAIDTWEEIGDYLGTTKQNAYTAVMVALGKVVFELRETIRKGQA